MSKKVRIEITRKGVYHDMGDGEGEKCLPIGTVLELDKEPTGWANKYRVLGKKEGKQLETGDKGKNSGKSGSSKKDDKGADDEKAALLKQAQEAFVAAGGKLEDAGPNWGVPAYQRATRKLKDEAENGNGDNF